MTALLTTDTTLAPTTAEVAASLPAIDAATALAQHIAAQPVAWYAGGLLLASLLAVIVWRGLDWRRSRRAALPRTGAGDVMPLLVAFSLAVAVFALIAANVQHDGALVRFDHALAGQLALDATPAVLQGFALVTRLADTSTMTVLCLLVAAGLWLRHHRRLALCWLAAVVGNSVLNVSLKAVFERARPVHEHGVTIASGWSFPSGHSSGAMVVWGMLAFIGWRLLPPRWHFAVTWLAASVVFTIGFSRILLHVHFFSDVAAGFCSGLAWLLLCVTAMSKYEGRLPRVSYP